MKTSDRLVEAAAALLDEGGEAAVTLRGVSKAIGVSQNAPYRHFQNRSDLLAAVAIRDFDSLRRAFETCRTLDEAPLDRLRRAIGAFVEYGEASSARYRLLFSDPDIAARGGELGTAAMAGFQAFSALVEDAQRAGDLPSGRTAEFTGLILATLHGLLDFRAGGRMRSEKGLTSVLASADLLLDVLSGTR